MDLGGQYNDPYLVQFYLDEADRMYAAINRGIEARGVAPLPIAPGADPQAQRAMAVVAECKQNMAATYAEGVTRRFVQNCTLSRQGLEHRTNIA